MKAMLSAAVMALALTGCASKTVDNTKVMTLEGETVAVKVKDISSFQVEIAPRKAVCQIKDSKGNSFDGECLQYRRTTDRNFNNLGGDITGFEYQDGYRYVLDVKQEALLDKDTNQMVPVWSLNKVISKTAELSSAQ